MEYIFHSVVKEESLHIYQGKKKTYGCWKGTPLHPLCDSTSLPWVDGSISSTVALRLRCCVLQHILNFDPHWGWPSLGKREWTSSQSCSKWAGDAFTAYIWDCGQPPPFSTGSENGLVIWLLDWKMNVQSPLSSNWTLAPTDVATIRPVLSDPVWNLLLQRPFFSFFKVLAAYELVLARCFYLSLTDSLSWTSSHRLLDWFGILDWTWVDSAHPLSDEWVSIWSGAKDLIVSSSSPNRLLQTYQGKEEKQIPDFFFEWVSCLVFYESAGLIFYYFISVFIFPV